MEKEIKNENIEIESEKPKKETYDELMAKYMRLNENYRDSLERNKYLEKEIAELQDKVADNDVLMSNIMEPSCFGVIYTDEDFVKGDGKVNLDEIMKKIFEDSNKEEEKIEELKEEDHKCECCNKKKKNALKKCIPALAVVGIAAAVAAKIKK